MLISRGADNIVGYQLFQRCRPVIFVPYSKHGIAGIGKVYRWCRVEGAMCLKIFNNKDIGPLYFPGMKSSGQDEDKNQDTDSDYEFSVFWHFTLKMDKLHIILQLTFYPKMT